MQDLIIYKDFIKEIKTLIYKRQYEAMKAVNKELLGLYWEIGEEINNQQKEKGWGKSVVEILAKELQLEFPGVKGFSAANLWRMRNFYLNYHENEKLVPLVREISWTKNLVIMERCKDDLEREFYLKMVRKFGWTKNVLINNLENKAYEKYLLNQTNFDETVPEKYRNQAKLSVKDDYNFDFLEMGLEHSEAELETALTKNIKAFLREVGDEFAFIDNQYHLVVDGEDFYIDLLLYHRRLKCLVAIELKIGKFEPEYAGKMQFYLVALDETKKLADENPSIGIIICKSKSRTIVEYALKTADMPIGVTTYNMYSTLPDNLKNLLPEPKEIANRLEILDELP
ncbi:MAG: PDDEXK nuclease domain-containing protein [Defluviitaleaceae bacterium]|nr:PDDEXK nuclease domain-containing protein [Defluviitaleaceae bacterium]